MMTFDKCVVGILVTERKQQMLSIINLISILCIIGAIVRIRRHIQTLTRLREEQGVMIKEFLANVEEQNRIIKELEQKLK